MPLVEYSDSEGSDHPDEGHNSTNVKRKRAPSPPAAISNLPPLPSTFHDRYASASRVSNTDDPSLHAGRQRQIPHVEGNWPSHVYIEWLPTTEQYARLQSIVQRVNEQASDGEADGQRVHSLLRSDLGTPMPLHISLSRPIVLRGEQRHEFLQSLTTRIRRLDIHPFNLRTVQSPDWVANHDSTRWFLVLRLEKDDGDSLSKLLRVSNQTARESGQLSLYEEQSPSSADGPMPDRKQRKLGRQGKARRRTQHDGNSGEKAGGIEEADFSMHFHISIAWTLAPPRSKEELPVRGFTEGDNAEKGLDVNIANVKVKIGNNINSVDLATEIRLLRKDVLLESLYINIELPAIRA